MEIGQVRLVYFSPTQTTRKVLGRIARGIRAARVTVLDLTPPDSAAAEPVEVREALAIIGVPVYGGRLPQEAVRRLRRLDGRHAVGDAVSTDAELCLHCCACVKNCPAGARIMEDPGIARSASWLGGNCAARREPETYWVDA